MAEKELKAATTLSYACIMPHGGDIIPELSTRKTNRLFERTRQSVRKIARDIRNVRPSTIVIASPHNLRLHENIAIVTSENSSGTLKGPGTRSVSLRLRCDRNFSRDLLNAAGRRSLPVVGANYGTAEGPASDMPMDWGTLVPMWFVAEEEKIKAETVIVTPSREIPLGQNIEFGKTIGELAEKRKERIVFIASADQAHAHKRSGPYGFDRAAAKYDELVAQAIRTNRIESITRLTKKFVEDAKPDSLWQMAILAGITRVVGMRGTLLSYEVPSYYGMICASFHRV